MAGLTPVVTETGAGPLNSLSSVTDTWAYSGGLHHVFCSRRSGAHRGWVPGDGAVVRDVDSFLSE